jgi:hypothetical protein
MNRSTSATTKRFDFPSFTYDNRGRRPAVQYDIVRGLTFRALAVSWEVSNVWSAGRAPMNVELSWCGSLRIFASD